MPRSKKSLIIEILFIFLLSLVPLLWFKPGEMMVGHDNAYPLNPKVFLEGRLYTWIENEGFGLDQSLVMGTIPMHFLETIPSLLGFSLITGQKIIFVFWFFLMGLSVYTLASLIKPESRFFKLIITVFYQFNFFILQAWFIFERAKFSAYVAMPLVLSLFLLVYRQKISVLKGAILSSLCLFIFNAGGTFGIPLYGGFFVALGLLVVYFSLVSFFQKKYFLIKRFIFLLCFTLVGAILFNAYYILPAFSRVLSQYQLQKESFGGVEGLVSWARMISVGASPLNLFRLQGMADWYDNLQHPYAQYYLTKPILIVFSFVWPVLIFLSLILIKNEPKKKFVLYFFLVYLVGIFFAAGTQPPLGFIYVFLMKYLPGFVTFRGPFYKFAPALFLAASFLMAFSLDWFKEKINSKFFRFIFGLFCLTLILGYHFPYFKVDFFNWRDNFSTRLKVPEYVFEFANWIEKEKKDNWGVLVLPPENNDVEYDIYKWGYLSFYPLPRLLTNQPVLLNDEKTKYKNDEKAILNFVYQTLLNGDEEVFKIMAAKLRIGYLLLREDFFYDLDWSPTDSPQKYLAAIKSFSFLKEERRFGEWRVYSVDLDDFSPPFYLSKEGGLSFFRNPQVEDQFILFAARIKSLKEFEGLKENFISGQCLRCNLTKDRIYPDLPTVLILPDSVFYPLVIWREENLEEKIEKLNNPAEIVNLNLGLASKRLAEIKRLIYEKKDKEKIKKTISEYRLKIQKILNQLEKVDKNEAGILLVVGDYLQYHREIIGSLAKEELFSEVSLSIKDVFWELESVLSELKKQQWTSGKEIKRYILEIPQEGEYEILIEQGVVTPLKFYLDDQEKEISAGEEEKFLWLSLGNYHLAAGKHQLTVLLPELFNFSSRTDFSFSTKNDGYELVFPLSSSESDKSYRVSFTYRAENEDSFHLVIVQDTDRDDKERPGIIRHLIDNTLFLRKSWRDYDVFFDQNPLAKEIILKISFDRGQNKENTIDFKNFEISKIWNPKVVLKKTAKSEGLANDQQPLDFRKINATRYELDLPSLKDSPSNLFFSQGFHPDWQLKIGQKTIPKERHFLADGYLNGWLINPQDFEGQASSRLTVEFLPQKLFYQGIFVSGLSLLISLLYLCLKR